MTPASALVLAATFAALPRPIPGHLEPCRDILLYLPYQLTIRSRVQTSLGLDQTRLRDADRVLVMLVQPAFEPEYAVSLFVAPDGVGILATKAQQQLSHANEVEVPVPGVPNAFTYEARTTPAAVPVSRTERRLSAALTTEVMAALIAPVKAARYRVTPRLVLDGVSYTFQVFEPESGTFCGTTHSPEPGSLPDRIRDLGDRLFQFARAPTTREDFIREALRRVRGDLGV